MNNDHGGVPAAIELDLAPPSVELEHLPDGGMILRSSQKLQPYARSFGELLGRSAARYPNRTFLAERNGTGWRKISYAQALSGAQAIGQALLERGLGPERALMILSGNSIDHALMALGGLLAGAPVAPISPAYSLMSKDFGKLRHIFELVRPVMIFATPAAAFANALTALNLSAVELVTSGAGEAATPIEDLLTTRPGPELDRAAAAIEPDSPAKYLFTSGSTGAPKGVINTHRMMCANQRMEAQVWPFLEKTPPVLLDWLPWNHTFGGNQNFNLVVSQAGTLFIDDGKPLPGLIEKTAANLREVSPTVYYNVPAGYAQLTPLLEQDDALARKFFERLQFLFYAGAALPPDLWTRIEALSIKARGERVYMGSGWGATETGPACTVVHYATEFPGDIGLPLPGVEIKMVPAGSKLELRLRGPNIMQGYLKNPELTREAFDGDGFYKMGDAGRLADADDPSRGILFDGRVAEDFKLDTGTWVNAGGLRVRALAATSPVLQDAVVTGHDRAFAGLLAWPNLAACAALCGEPALIDDPAALIARPDVIDRVRAGLARHNAANPGSSTRIKRVIVMTEPPQIDANEITDKGYVNQGATLARRAPLVERLYRDPPPDNVIVIQD
ncbi:MAG: feruloyl-CoA synthase [Sphingomonadales bacterium]